MTGPVRLPSYNLLKKIYNSKNRKSTILIYHSCCKNTADSGLLMDTNRILNIIIASPGDIVIERKIVREVCLGLNESELLHHLRVHIQTAMWEEVFPSAEHPQAIIDRVAGECDILVCIFCKRF